MALLTKLFERNASPYSLKGRWHRVHVDTSGTIDYYDNKLNPRFLSDNLMYIGAKLKVVDYLIFPGDSLPQLSNITFTKRLDIYSNGNVALVTFNKTLGVSFYVYVFIIED